MSIEGVASEVEFMTRTPFIRETVGGAGSTESEKPEEQDPPYQTLCPVGLSIPARCIMNHNIRK